MVNDVFEDELIGSPWQSNGAVGEAEVVSHWDIDDVYTDDDTDDDHYDDTDDDNDHDVTWQW